MIKVFHLYVFGVDAATGDNLFEYHAGTFDTRERCMEEIKELERRMKLILTAEQMDYIELSCSQQDMVLYDEALQEIARLATIHNL